MSARPSAKALITTGICLLGGSLLLQLVYLLFQEVAISSYYGGASFGWGALNLFNALIQMAGYTGGAILAGGLVVKALGPQTPTRPGQPQAGHQPQAGPSAPQAPSGYQSGSGYPAPGQQTSPGYPAGYQAPGSPTSGYPGGQTPGYQAPAGPVTGQTPQQPGQGYPGQQPPQS